MDRCGSIGGDRLADDVWWEVERAGCLGKQDLRIGEGAVRRAGQLQIESPAALVGPELRPRLVVVAAIALGGDEHERPVQAGVDNGPEQGAVQVDARLDPLVLEHRRGGGRAAEGVTEHEVCLSS